MGDELREGEGRGHTGVQTGRERTAEAQRDDAPSECTHAPDCPAFDRLGQDAASWVILLCRLASVSDQPGDVRCGGANLRS